MMAEVNCRPGWLVYNRSGNTSTGAVAGAGTLKRLAGVLVDSSELTCWVASVAVTGCRHVLWVS